MGGFSRILISKGFSLLYIIIIARLIAKPIMDQLIILAIGQLIITQIATLGMKYSGQQRTLSTTGELSAKIRYNATLIMLTVATPFSIILALPVTYYVVGFNHPELYLTYPLSIALLIIKDTETTVERSFLAVDKALVIDMIYSILSSVLVPLFFYINPSLESVIWAWNVALIATVLLNIATLFRITRLKLFNSQIISDLLHFSFPLYLASLPSPIANNLNNLIIYENFEVGAMSIFYWPNRLLSIASEMLMITLTGSQELFTHLKTISIQKLRDSFLAVFRSLAIISTVFFFLIYLNSSLIILLILGSGYTQASHLFRLLCFAWAIMTVKFSMSYLKGAEAHRRVIVKVNLLNIGGKIFFLLILIQFGLEGIVFAEILTAATIFSYYAINTKFFRVNDNFIRLCVFIAIIIGTSILESFLVMNDLFSFTILNLIYMGIVILSFLLIRPLTTRDIIFVKKIIPSRLTRIIDFYHPSKSYYDNTNLTKKNI